MPANRLVRLEQAFFDWGWLLPVLLPLAQAGGRAALHIIAAAYVLWGIIALCRRGFEGERTALWLYGLLLGAYAISIPYAQDSPRAADKWLTFAYQSAAFPLTLAVFQRQGPAAAERLGRMLRFGALVLLPVLYGRMLWLALGDDWRPAQQLKEDNLVWLLPFLLAAPLSSGGRRGWWTVGVLATVLIYIEISGGRAALFGALLGLVVYGVIGWRWRPVRILALVAALLTLVMATDADHFIRSAHREASLNTALDTFTSLRTVLWRQALSHPPERTLTGVGMGNLRYHDAVAVVGEQRFGHLHNFILDAWYETGLLGLAALLAFLAYPWLRLARAWPRLEPPARQRLAPFIAATVALAATAMLSFSYASPQFALYLSILMAALLGMARTTPSLPQSEPGPEHSGLN